MSQKKLHISDEMLVKYLLQECNSTEIIEVEIWLNNSTENQFYYNQLLVIWNQSKQLQPNTIIDEEQAWLRLKSKMQKPKQRFISIKMLAYSAAATIALLIGLFYIFKPTSIQKTIITKQKDSISVQQIAVAQNPIKEIKSDIHTLIDTLSDKSIVTLNKNAVLEYPSEFSNKERRIKLNGEAFFNITPNKEKPFFIDASNNVEIRVVGTSFNVKSFDAFNEVIVETGIVEVKKYNRVVLLHPREKARINKMDSTIIIEKNKDKLYKYYRSKEFECDNTPLWKVVEVLNEAYNNRVSIANYELRSLTLTTRFDNESLESILEIISETFEIKVEKQGNKYILK